MNHARVRSGMMFAAVPPSWMIPWTRQWGGSCWRQRPTLENSAIIASSALRPSHGSLAACDWRPLNTTETSSDASGWQSTWLRSQGWYRSAASSPSNSPSSSMNCLPLPRSSAGVPRNTISPANESRIAASAIAAPTPDAAIVLCPQPWPRPGSASYSARIPIRGPSIPFPPASRPRTAVARRPAGCSTSRPCARIASATQPAAWTSSNAGSGVAWMRCDRSRISSRAASTAAAAAPFSSANGAAGWWVVRLDMGLLTFGGEGDLGHDEDGAEEQQDRQLERVDETEDDEHGGEQADPRAASGGPGPVALVGDPAVASEHDEPAQGRREEADRHADRQGADVAGHGIAIRIAGREDDRDDDPRDPRRGEQREVRDPVPCLHRPRVYRRATDGGRA